MAEQLSSEHLNHHFNGEPARRISLQEAIALGVGNYWTTNWDEFSSLQYWTYCPVETLLLDGWKTIATAPDNFLTPVWLLTTEEFNAGAGKVVLGFWCDPVRNELEGVWDIKEYDTWYLSKAFSHWKPVERPLPPKL